MSATMTAPPVTVRRLPIPANSCHGNAHERPEFVSCDDPIDSPMNLPSTPSEWLELHPDGFWQLGAVLRPVSGIVQSLMNREGLTYAEAVQSLIADHFVLRYETYLAKYDPTRGTDFFAYCKIRFVYLVRESHAHRAAHLRTYKHKVTSPLQLPQADQVEKQKTMQVIDCQACKAVALEDRQAELQTLADVCERLKSLDKVASFVLWNHTGLGRTYDELGQYLGMAPKSVKQVHIGAVAAMRRMLGVKVG